MSGFMPQEVSGTLAFTYMHKDDVRWVMIALRQSKYFDQHKYYISKKYNLRILIIVVLLYYSVFQRSEFWQQLL